MAQNGPKWPKMAQNYPKWPKNNARNYALFPQICFRMYGPDAMPVPNLANSQTGGRYKAAQSKPFSR